MEKATGYTEKALGNNARPAGLTAREAAERAERGLANRTDIKTDKSVREIVQSNLLTYFNLIFLIIAVLLCMVGSYRNLTFLPIIVINTAAGIVQELRAKRVLDKMNMLNAPFSTVIRDGEKLKIPSEDLVKGDCVLLTAGNQICADAEVLQGSIAVNEALITGEADEVRKEKGDRLLSGSFVVSGRCYAVLDRVGSESYISKLTAQAKAMGSGEQSEMIRSLNRLVKWVGIIILPVAAILFAQAYFMNGETLRKSVVSVIAAVIGMIPEGLYLLTTVSLTLSTMRLAGKKVLLHDMKSIETLARVDVLCVDKTGTITEPGMEVDAILPCGGGAHDPEAVRGLKSLLRDYAAAAQDDNATMQAIRSFADADAEERQDAAECRAPSVVRPFSSERKYGMISFEDETLVLGAPEFVLREENAGYAGVREEIAPYLKQGCRVLLLGRYAGRPEGDGEKLPDGITPLGYVILKNSIRENAKETFAYFREQGVEIKVISGDNPETVAEVAARAGIENADRYTDASLLQDYELESAAKKYTVFGRVTPGQKQLLVRQLQRDGHTVAMTGDGVNDILAMKDADCSVAMASGSEAAAQAAQVVLLDSDFARMPHVVLEGRQVVNNLQRSASLFLVKNIFSLLMALCAAVSAMTYPLEPAQISLISMFTIGAPGFLLAFEPNRSRIEGRFMRNVMMKALPAGLTDVLIVGTFVFCGKLLSFSEGDIATAATVLLAIVGFLILAKISRPFNRIKAGILALNVSGLLFCGIFLNDLFAVSGMSELCVLLTVVFAFAAESLLRYLGRAVDKLNRMAAERKACPRTPSGVGTGRMAKPVKYMN